MTIGIETIVLVNHLEELGQKICEFNKLPDLSNISSLATATTVTKF